ncbi:hypothetical protein SAMN06264364_10170 [Quadrisphaera granulorum]|uniref:Uncharacterized protein n=1 Tax=Quadrisphaera granulorum TaxID=317664 RepID=A0A316AE86_9ACTN|nr:hypothetical protein [Quadrisphaera granulorum]PWJ56096.1 hypothetical protein BXY45_10170 [Quadrisphaera granulorum]SZE94730.1 hypothetical protein SAMN06264364_10170 [Quadrisphaera granulorum]
MSTTLPLPAPGLDPAAEAREYAAAVRAELADLPAEVIEELTGGLEADLAELAAETSTPLLDRLGSARAYAEELRSAAGLPPHAMAAAPEKRSGIWSRATEGAREDIEHAVAHLRSRTWWPGFVERAQLVRPAWWLVRGALLAWLVARFLFGPGASLGGLLLLIAGAVVSLEVGRRYRPVARWKRSLIVAANVLAVILLPFAVVAMTSRETVYVDAGYSSSGPDTSRGVWFDGQVVTNIYPYDAQGRPLTGVQLLDDYGRPLATSTGDRSDWSTGQPNALVPAVTADGEVRWNAYPLRAQLDGTGGAPRTPSFPEQSLSPLVGIASGVVPSPEPTPTMSVTAAPSPTDVPSEAPTASSTAIPPVVTSTESPYPAPSVTATMMPSALPSPATS